MKRISVPELEDLPFLPAWYRDLMTDVLERLSTLFGAYDQTLPFLERLLKSERAIVDFGSGASGPLVSRLLPQLLKRFPELQVTLTDLYPNARVVSKMTGNLPVSYVSTPVDMTAPPDSLKGVRTMFTAFHHLPEDQALQVLSRAQEERTPIGIFEATGRTPAHFLMALIIPVIILFMTPFLSGRRALRLASTYLIPLVPLGCLWDGLLSNLRTYEKRDLERLIQQLPKSAHYEFSIGTFQVFGPIRGTYLIGYECADFGPHERGPQL